MKGYNSFLSKSDSARYYYLNDNCNAQSHDRPGTDSGCVTTWCFCLSEEQSRPGAASERRERVLRLSQTAIRHRPDSTTAAAGKQASEGWRSKGSRGW